jgi:hypothetical protein
MTEQAPWAKVRGQVEERGSAARPKRPRDRTWVRAREGDRAKAWPLAGVPAGAAAEAVVLVAAAVAYREHAVIFDRLVKSVLLTE